MRFSVERVGPLGWPALTLASAIVFERQCTGLPIVSRLRVTDARHRPGVAQRSRVGSAGYAPERESRSCRVRFPVSLRKAGIARFAAVGTDMRHAFDLRLLLAAQAHCPDRANVVRREQSVRRLTDSTTRCAGLECKAAQHRDKSARSFRIAIPPHASMTRPNIPGRPSNAAAGVSVPPTSSTAAP